MGVPVTSNVVATGLNILSCISGATSSSLTDDEVKYGSRRVRITWGLDSASSCITISATERTGEYGVRSTRTHSVASCGHKPQCISV